MKKLILNMTLVGVLGLAPAPVPADAATAGDCLIYAWHSCDEDYPSDYEIVMVLRGYCYLGRWAICLF